MGFEINLDLSIRFFNVHKTKRLQFNRLTILFIGFESLV